MKRVRYWLLVFCVVGLFVGNQLRADPPGSLPPFVVSVDPNGTTISWTTVDFVSSGPTGDLYMVTVVTAFVYADTGEVLELSSYSYLVLDSGPVHHDAD